MARPMSTEKKREKTEESLKNALLSRKMSDKFLTDKVDEYMSFYDDLFYINQTLIQLKKNENCSLKIYTDAVAEKRRDIFRDEKYIDVPGAKTRGCGTAGR